MPVRRLDEVVADGRDVGVVVGRRQLGGQQPRAAGLVEFIDVGGGDDVAAADFQDVVGRQRQQIGFGGNVQDVLDAVANLDVVDGHGLAAIFVNDHADVAHADRRELELPVVPSLSAIRLAERPGAAGSLGFGPVEIEVDFAERDRHDLGGCRRRRPPSCASSVVVFAPGGGEDRSRRECRRRARRRRCGCPCRPAFRAGRRSTMAGDVARDREAGGAGLAPAPPCRATRRRSGVSPCRPAARAQNRSAALPFASSAWRSWSARPPGPRW